MTTKYGFSDVRDQLLKDLKGAYPTRWQDFRNARILGEGVFGSPKPHPNAVLNLFVAQNVAFAIPFAAYRASIGGFSVLMGEKPGAVLPGYTLTATVHGMHNLRSMAAHSARKIAYGGDLRVCPDGAVCVLRISNNPIKPRLEAMEKIYDAMVAQREGGILAPPSLGHLLCTTCAKYVQEAHASWGSFCWGKLALVFNISHESGDDL